MIYKCLQKLRVSLKVFGLTNCQMWFVSSKKVLTCKSPISFEIPWTHKIVPFFMHILENFFCKEFWDNRETINMILKTKTKMWRLDVCLFIHYLTTIYDMWYVFDLGLQEGLIKSRWINWLENNLYISNIILKGVTTYVIHTNKMDSFII